VQAEGRLDLWQIAMKPGKPLAFGRVPHRRERGALFMGLPGNPVSSFVTFLLAVAPVLRALQGADRPPARGLPLRADFDWPRPDRGASSCACASTAGGLDLFPTRAPAC
jgi:molybdopterin molybdotransferase